MFKVSDYWPFPKAHQHIRFDYSNKNTPSMNVTSIFEWDELTNSLVMANFDAKYEWLNTWFLRNSALNGLIEWRDDFPVTGWRRFLLGDKKKEVYKPAKGIIWGRFQDIGDTISGQIEIDHSQSNILIPFKGPWSFGWQQVRFRTLHTTYTTSIGTTYNDVLEFDYLQKWGKETVGAIYFMPKGIGPVEIRWLGTALDGGLIVTEPIAADPVIC